MQRAIATVAAAVPYRCRLNGPAHVGENGTGVVQIVRSADPARRIRRGGEPREVVVLHVILAHLHAVIVNAATCHRQHGLQHIMTELGTDALSEIGGGESIAHAILDHIVQHAGDDHRFFAFIVRQNHRDIGGVRDIRHAQSFAHLRVVVLGRIGERVVDAV